MADSPPNPDSNDDTRAGPGRGSTTSTPRWVKLFAIIALVLVLLFIILHVACHGLRGHTPSSSVPAQGADQT